LTAVLLSVIGVTGVSANSYVFCLIDSLLEVGVASWTQYELLGAKVHGYRTNWAWLVAVTEVDTAEELEVSFDAKEGFQRIISYISLLVAIEERSTSKPTSSETLHSQAWFQQSAAVFSVKLTPENHMYLEIRLELIH
jgi:hypothetical protein